ncbi:MAG: rRNA pseudouridine synthase [Oscillospiraceae bacterium]|nr:rRNA pseudouridine synthase [Oscillospiraceae bacterium]
MQERLQKILSARGIASRRAAEDYITAGRVAVNGVAARLGEKADPELDSITIDGRPLPQAGACTYIMLHKPAGYISSCADDRGRKTVLTLVAGCGRRVWPVGRLDQYSEGLLLLTDDGDFTQRLTHPRHEVEKEYHVTVRGDIACALPVLRSEMTLDETRLRPALVRVLKQGDPDGVLSITIREGKNRQVRRLCAAAGLQVLRLVRVREGSLLLGALPPGKWRTLTAEEVARLKGEEKA